jgi:hypothetical protein
MQIEAPATSGKLNNSAIGVNTRKPIENPPKASEVKWVVRQVFNEAIMIILSGVSSSLRGGQLGVVSRKIFHLPSIFMSSRRFRVRALNWVELND